MKPRFLWRRIPDSSDLGILPAAYMRELGSAYETLASLNQASDAISNLIVKKKKLAFGFSAVFTSWSYISVLVKKLKVTYVERLNSGFIFIVVRNKSCI